MDCPVLGINMGIERKKTQTDLPTIYLPDWTHSLNFANDNEETPDATYYSVVGPLYCSLKSVSMSQTKFICKICLLLSCKW